jgi:hypothetical protein
MNFSEYIAILSGDNSLLEKAKLEKKIGVLESLKGAHFREISRSKNKLEHLASDKESKIRLLSLLSNDQALYKGNLQHDKEGTKLNPIRLIDFEGNDPEAVGKHLINLYQKTKPLGAGLDYEKKIGTLYDFDLYVRSKPGIFYFTSGEYANDFYAVNPQSGIKYTYNGGQPNLDNPKLAARNFLNAIDRVDHLLGQHRGEVGNLEQEAATLSGIIRKPFEKDQELKTLKQELAGLEVKITGQIQAKSSQGQPQAAGGAESLQTSKPNKEAVSEMAESPLSIAAKNNVLVVGIDSGRYEEEEAQALRRRR